MSKYTCITENEK